MQVLRGGSEKLPLKSTTWIPRSLIHPVCFAARPASIAAIVCFLFSGTVRAGDLHFPENFVFGVATAPAQSEDCLDDIWTDWGKSGGIRAYLNQAAPEKRAASWSRPEPDLLLLDQLGVQGVRLGLDWGRIEPAPGRFDEDAILKYRSLLQRVKAGGHKIMLTLSHHSVPKWVQEKGGWKNPETVGDFFEFSKRILREFHSVVDWWITFNEPQIFTLFAYQAGIWPPGERGGILSFLDLPFYQGSGIRVVNHMIDAHKRIYDFARRHFPSIRMGIAQNVADYRGATFIGGMLAPRVDSFMNWTFLDGIRGSMDFVGLNYYGAEWLGATGIEILPEEEYSEAGRAVFPQGLLRILRESRSRYPLPIMITENGIADSTDWIRPLYLAEHLAAVHRGIKEGIPIQGYFHWTLSDNLEWSDGYCPRFGLVEVDRNRNLERIPRKSFHFYREIVRSRTLSGKDRVGAWQEYQKHRGGTRPFCRAKNGRDALDSPEPRIIPGKDWRLQ